MPKVEQAGKYRGFITDHVVDLSKNGAVQLICSCECRTVRTEGGDYLELAEPQHITAYKVLIKKNGEKAGGGVESIKKAFEWDGKSLSALAHMKLTGREFEFVIANKIDEKQNPTDELEVCWINRPGGLREVKPETLAELDARWAKLMGEPESAPQQEAEPDNSPF